AKPVLLVMSVLSAAGSADCMGSTDGVNSTRSELCPGPSGCNKVVAQALVPPDQSFVLVRQDAIKLWFRRWFYQRRLFIDSSNSAGGIRGVGSIVSPNSTGSASSIASINS